MSRHRQRTCHGKRRYRDRNEALRIIRAIQRKSSRDRVPNRAYKCPDCAGWHITSQERRT